MEDGSLKLKAGSWKDENWTFLKN